VEENVLKSAGVSVGENEPVAVDPLGVLGVGVEEAGCTMTDVSMLLFRGQTLPPARKDGTKREEGDVQKRT
jgi:hypothetical protein